MSAMRSIKFSARGASFMAGFPHAELNRIIAERAQPVNGCSDWHRAST
jgi:hypothetical protein